MTNLLGDKTNQKLLNLLQADFPIVEFPYKEIASKLDIEEEDCLNRIRNLKGENIIRQISAIFDTKSLGYKSSLVAMRIKPEELDERAAIINEHAGVSHNYRRNHPMNLWLTIAVPPDSSLDDHVNKLGELAGAEETLLLPTLKLFKIGVKLDVTDNNDLMAKEKGEIYNEKKRNTMRNLLEEEKKIVLYLQDDLDLTTSTPFLQIAEKAGLSLHQLIEHANTLKNQGIMRRFAAILKHRKAGFKANAMGIWKVPQEQAEKVGEQMASFKVVSHCYLRPVYPDWPYNVFTMVHAKSIEECQSILKTISEETNITDYSMLYSTKEYKKIRVRYFTGEIEEWEKKYLNNNSS